MEQKAAKDAKKTPKYDRRLIGSTLTVGRDGQTVFYTAGHGAIQQFDKNGSRSIAGTEGVRTIVGISADGKAILAAGQTITPGGPGSPSSHEYIRAWSIADGSQVKEIVLDEAPRGIAAGPTMNRLAAWFGPPPGSDASGASYKIAIYEVVP